MEIVSKVASKSNISSNLNLSDKARLVDLILEGGCEEVPLQLSHGGRRRFTGIIKDKPNRYKMIVRNSVPSCACLIRSLFFYFLIFMRMCK